MLVRQLLSMKSDSGKAGIEAGTIITIKPDAYETYRANPDFIQRYIFIFYLRHFIVKF